MPGRSRLRGLGRGLALRDAHLRWAPQGEGRKSFRSYPLHGACCSLLAAPYSSANPHGEEARALLLMRATDEHPRAVSNHEARDSAAPDRPASFPGHADHLPDSHLKQPRPWLHGLAAHPPEPCCNHVPPTIERAQGMPDAGRTHGPPAEKIAGGSHHRFSREQPAFPARWSSRLYAVSLVRRACWPPCATMLAHCAGHQHRGVRTLRLHVHGPTVRRRARRHAAADRGHRLPTSRVVTIARNAPLVEAG